MWDPGSHLRPADSALAFLSRSPRDSSAHLSLRSAGLGLRVLVHCELRGRSLNPERDCVRRCQRPPLITPFPEPPSMLGSTPKPFQPSTASLVPCRQVGVVPGQWVPSSLFLMENAAHPTSPSFGSISDHSTGHLVLWGGKGFVFFFFLCVCDSFGLLLFVLNKRWVLCL